jgi:hypothetical protein
MKSVDPKIDRLLRSAAQAHEDVPAAMPFGFDTRIVALWRSSMKKPNGLTPLLRRIALLSAVVIVVSTIAAAREAGQNRKLGESFANEYAIADSAIQDEFSQ